MIRYVTIICATLMLLTAGVPGTGVSAPPNPSPPGGDSDPTGEVLHELEDHVRGIVDPTGEYPIHSAALQVNAPYISFKGAAGTADGRSEQMTVDHKFKIGSIAKTMTATVILQLVEEGRLRFDDTLDGAIDASCVDLDTLHIFDGTPFGRVITIRQLLGHISGIRDWMEDDRFVPYVLEHADTQWTPAMIFGCYYDWGVNTRAAFPPGEGYAYSDLNYVLLAMVIERVTGETLVTEYRKRIFDPLGMANTYLEYYEEPRGSHPLSHAFFGDMDISASINTSFDWGGGGVVSTCQDLDLFFRALLEGRLFTKESTLRQMLAAAELGHGGEEYDYGLGIMKRIIEGFTFYGHGGAYDCDFFLSPEAGLSVCSVLNQMETQGKRDPFFEKAVALARRRDSAK